MPEGEGLAMSSPSIKKLTGGCYCGAVGYTVADAFDYALNCHCGNCHSSLLVSENASCRARLR